jgi:superfamily II helicase
VGREKLGGIIKKHTSSKYKWVYICHRCPKNLVFGGVRMECKSLSTKLKKNWRFLQIFQHKDLHDTFKVGYWHASQRDFS